MIIRLLFFFIVFFLTIPLLSAREFFVSPIGNDAYEGSIDRPFKTIQRAADVMLGGDICFIREGVYNETVILKNSGTKAKPIRFESYRNENVILSGVELIHSKWEPYKDGIFKCQLQETEIEQLFIGSEMLIEARWPNLTFDEVFDRNKWAKVDFGSKHGMVLSETVAKTGIDFTGAQAYLNVAHQWWTWNRPITMHEAGSNKLFYDADLVGLCNYIPEFMNEDNLKKKWGDDYFYLFGILGALDVENEWFFDKETKELYLFPPDGKNPNDLKIQYKKRNYGFLVKDKEYIQLEGINFFACSFRFDDCNYSSVTKANMMFPTYSRTITEYDKEREESIITKMVGDYNTVDQISIQYANNLGLMMMGNYNKVNNSIISDINWSGTLIYPALQLSSSPHLGVNWFNTIQYPPTVRTPENSEVTSFGNVASNNTLYNCGGPILVYHAAESLVEYNHVYDGGLACKDVSLIYGCWPFSHSSTIRYNWVHGCMTDGWSGRGGKGGMGIRADDQSRKNFVHHNVVWDIGDKGIIVKGEDNLVYNNTILGEVKNPIMLPQQAEPYKQWAVKWPRFANQNRWTRAFNNITPKISSRKEELEEDENINNNFLYKGSVPLVNIEKRDFRPQPGSPLENTGILPSFLSFAYSGLAPDMGAYESDADYWVPGADWDLDHSWLKLIEQNR